MKKLLLLLTITVNFFAMSMDLRSLVGQCAAIDKILIWELQKIKVTGVNPFKKNGEERATITADGVQFVAKVRAVNCGGRTPCWEILAIIS